MPTSTEKFVKLSASAGSGKTYRLAQEYIATAIETTNSFTFQKILAVTFTNKAAEELKDRIISFLNDTSTAPDSDSFLVALCEKTTLDAKTVRQRCENVLQTILNNYSRFAVSTIDTFTQKLIRSFSKDLELSNNYEVELDEDKVKVWVSKSIIADVGLDPILSDVLNNWCSHILNQERSIGNIEKDLAEYTATAMSEKAIIYANSFEDISDESFKELENKINKEQKDFLKTYASKIDELKALLQQAGINTQSFKSKSKGPLILLDKPFKSLLTDKLKERFLKLLDIDNLMPKEGDGISFLEEHHPKIVEFATYTLEHVERYCSNEIILKNLYLLRLHVFLRRKLKSYSEEHNTLLIADFNKIISEQVLQENADFIFEQLGNRFNYIYIDEFQDTSILQFHNFLPLISNALATGGKVILVGDPKQAIYSFRGGEQELIERLPAVLNPNENPFIDQEAHVLNSHYVADNLTQNYRSRKNIIDFNNKLCGALYQVFKETSETFNNSTQEHTSKTDTDGRVQYRSLKTEDYKNIDITPADASLNYVLEDIKKLKQQGYEYKDMALLLRTSAEINTCVNFFVEKNIPFVSDKSLLIKNTPVVKGILGLLKLHQDPNDAVGKSYVLEYFSKEYNTQAFDVAQQLFTKSGFNSKALKEVYKLNLQALFATPSVYTIVGNIYNALSKDNTAAPSHMHFFFEYCYAYLQNNGENLDGLIEDWDTKEYSLKLADEINAVRLLSVHKSKGLQFPCVFLPFVNWSDIGGTGGVQFWSKLSEQYAPLSWSFLEGSKSLASNSTFESAFTIATTKELNNTANNFYVACTRAEDFLSINQTNISKTTSSLFQGMLVELGKNALTEEVENLYSVGDWPTKKKKENLSSSTHKILTYLKNQPSEAIHYAVAKESDTDIYNPQYFGVLVHEILATSKTQIQLEKNLNKRLYNGQISQEEKEKLNKIVQPVLTRGIMQGWLGETAEYLSEVTLQYNVDQTCRPDLISITKEAVFVIDFKTGGEKKEHQKQVDEYARILAEIGYKNITTHIEYIDTSILETA